MTSENRKNLFYRICLLLEELCNIIDNQGEGSVSCSPFRYYVLLSQGIPYYVILNVHWLAQLCIRAIWRLYKFLVTYFIGCWFESPNKLSYLIGSACQRAKCQIFFLLCHCIGNQLMKWCDGKMNWIIKINVFTYPQLAYAL